MKTIYGILLTTLFISCVYTTANASAASSSSDNGSIVNQIVMPGNFPDFFCQEKSSGYNTVIINQTGFVRSEPDQLYFGHMHVYDYMLLPGHNATITYALQNGTSSDRTNGDVVFFHDGGQQDHLGLTVQSSPVFNVTGGIGETMLFSASASASHGTYWMTLPPSYCASGMVILFTVGESISPNLSIPSSFTSSMDKQTYSRTDDMLVKILGVPYNILQLTIFSDNSHTVALNDTIMIDPDGESAYWLHANNFPDNEYTVILASQNKTSTIHFTIEPKTETVSSMSNATTYGIYNNTEIQKSETQYANQISSPLKQFKSGVAVKDVKCSPDLQLVIKVEDGSPACTTPLTALHLISLDWGYVSGQFTTTVDLLDSKISGGRIVGYQYDIQSTIIIIKIQTINNGSLSVVIPQVLLNKEFWSSENHVVLADGKEMEHQEALTLKGLNLTIPFENGTNEIELIGNFRG